MKTKNWEAMLMEFFKKSQLLSTSVQQEIWKNSLDKFMGFINTNSRMNSEIKFDNNGQHLAYVKLVPFEYGIAPLTLKIELDKQGRFITIDRPITTKKLEDERAKIKIGVNENEILETLTNILVKYNG